MLLEELGMLADLPKVELAKLVGEADELVVEAGDYLRVENAVYLVCSGSLCLLPQDCVDADMQALTHVGAGEIVGEWVLLSEYEDPPEVLAVTTSVLFRIPAERWNALVGRYPSLGRTFQESVLQRLLTTQQTLGRYKRYMNTYITEIWSVADKSVMEPAAAAEAAPMPARMGTGGRPSEHRATGARGSVWEGQREPLRVWSITALFVAAGLVLANIPQVGASTTVLGALILGWTAVNWYLNTLPDYAVALSACLATVLLGVSRPGETFGGFADPTWFLLLGAFAIGAAVQRSGLLYRLSLHLLRLLPPSYLGQATALAISGTLLTPCLPSVQSRVTMAGLLARELSEAMRFRPQSRGSAGLAMSAFLGFGQMRFLFLNGSSYSLLAWGLLPIAVRQGAGWAEWFWVALPVGLLVLVATHLFTVNWMFREEGAIVSRTVINRQLSILGKMSLRERVISAVILLVFGGFLLQPLHGMDPSWIALGGFLVLVMFGVLDKDLILNGIDWQYMLFYGSLAGLVAVVAQTHLSDLLARYVAGEIGTTLGNPVVFLIAVGVFTTLFRLVFQPAPAILLTAVTFFPLSVTLGFNPLVAAVVSVASSTTWLVPQLLSSYTTLHSATQGQCFDHQQVRRLAIAHAVIVFGAIVASIPYWYVFDFLNLK